MNIHFTIPFVITRPLVRALRIAGALTVVSALFLGTRVLQRQLTDSSSVLVDWVQIQAFVPDLRSADPLLPTP